MTATAPVAPDHPPLPRPAVLVVNDREAARLGVKVMLAPLDIDVIEADSGRAALEAVKRQTFAVVLMDVRMPIMDGYESAKRIREQTDGVLTPIIFFTAFSQDDTETLTAYSTGAVDFIFTPVVADVLRAKVAAFVALLVQSQELKRSLESITALNTVLLERDVRERAVLENVADAIVTAGEAGGIETFNHSAQQLFGYSEEELIGEQLKLLVDPADHDAFFEGVPSRNGSRPELDTSTHRTETSGRRKDGASFPMEVALSRMRIGERTLTVVCIHDISERREQAEAARRRGQALRREAQRDRAAFDEAPIGNVIVSPDGLIERVNQAFCDMMEMPPDDLIGTQLLRLTHPDDRDRSSRVVAVLLNGGARTERLEKRYLLADGQVREARVALTAIRDDAQAVSQLFAQVEDVTEAKRTARELEQSQFEMLARLAAAAEFRDDDTGQHTRRVGDLSVAIAERLGLPDGQVELIRLAAPLHDVGKIAIPDALLGKPGKLTEAEFDQMKTHTTIGAQMLEGGAFALLEMAEEIALTHHERWDGRGYPAGLEAEKIPIVGRIVAVADVFDALTHERPYKAAWTEDEAITEMSSQSGRQFDPAVLDAFLALPKGRLEIEGSVVPAAVGG